MENLLAKPPRFDPSTEISAADWVAMLADFERYREGGPLRYLYYLDLGRSLGCANLPEAPNENEVLLRLAADRADQDRRDRRDYTGIIQSVGLINRWYPGANVAVRQEEIEWIPLEVRRLRELAERRSREGEPSESMVGALVKLVANVPAGVETPVLTEGEIATEIGKLDRLRGDRQGWSLAITAERAGKLWPDRVALSDADWELMREKLDVERKTNNWNAFTPMAAAMHSLSEREKADSQG